MSHVHVHVTGIVQGVGYRPFVWKLAHGLSLDGWVRNASDGVHIEAWGSRNALDTFVLRLSTQHPVAARVDTVHVEAIDNDENPPEGFNIIQSDAHTDRTALVSPDIATCAECEAELFDASDRRYHYPFINCTNCGPRFTLTQSLPYDRPHTSMATFEMCEACSHEYADPSDRRFHAQPDACFECGPHLTWRSADDPGTVLTGSDVEASDHIIDLAVNTLNQGLIVAIKGLGGYHLACDATNDVAVYRLRELKHRPSKPLAVMFPRLEDVRRALHVHPRERAVLTGSVRPICLLRRKPAQDVPQTLRIARSVAFDLPELGVMLPYTPLQHLLLHAIRKPLVMTSGNLSDEPIVCDDQLAVARLMGIADAWLGNNRPILARYDDSVVRVIDKTIHVVRRARGMAPTPIAFPAQIDGNVQPAILACGSEQKSTFTLTRADQAFVSPHIGDLAHAEAFDAWQECLQTYRELFGLDYDVIACDLHPEYLASKWARSTSAQQGTKLIEVQHHHAHIAAVLAENVYSEKVVGIALDGTGYGTDGTIWGGEILVGDCADSVRAAHLATWPLPGGEAAIIKPLRSAFGLLWARGMGESEAADSLVERMGVEGPVARQMVLRDLNSPRTSSSGRLFDAVSVLLGIIEEAGYDGEPACVLEAAALAAENMDDADPRYQLELRPSTLAERIDPNDESLILDPTQMIHAIIEDINAGIDVARIAKLFHLGFADGFAHAAAGVARASGLTTIALAGGVLQNRIVFERIHDDLSQAGFTVLSAKELPVNDGAISYGQAAVAYARLHQQTTAPNAL